MKTLLAMGGAMLLLLSCSDEPKSNTFDTGGSGGKGGSGGNGANTGDATISGGTGGTSGSGGGTAGSTAGGGGSGNAGGGEDAGDGAAPACGDFGQDPACKACLADKCCTEAVACDKDADCKGMVGCARACPDPSDVQSSCMQDCINQHNAGGGPYNPLILCLGNQCGSTCTYP